MPGIGYNRAMRARLPALAGALLLLLPVLALAGRLALFVTHSAAMLAYPWQLDFDEGIILHSSWLLAHGQSPYPPLAPNQFVSSLYPPLFYALNAVALRLGGLNLVSGRAFELAGTLLAAAVLVAWVRAETRSWAAGALAAAAWLALSPTIVWGSLYKQDGLALGLGALGGALLAWAWRTPPLPAGPSVANTGVGRLSTLTPPLSLPGRGSLAYWAIVPLVLAVWTKQTTLAPLLAGGVVALLRDWRGGLRWALAAGVALAGSLLLVNALLGGQLLGHLLMASGETLSPARLGKNLGAAWDEAAPLLALAGLAGLALLGWAVRARRVPSPALIYALASVPFVALTNLSPHANYNHLLPGLLPACLLAGVGLGHLGTLAPARREAWLPLAAGVAALCWQATLFGPLKDWYTPLGQPFEEKTARMETLVQAVAAVPGSSVLAEDDWLALRAGKRLPYDDPAQMTVQAAAGRWDESALLADIRRHRFGVLILEHDIAGETFTPRWSPAVLAALQAEYQPKYRDVRFLWMPRPPPTQPAQAQDCALAGGPRLIGHWLPGDGSRLAPGDSQPISLYWAAPAPGTAPRPDLKFSLRLLDPAGGVAWQADLAPGAAGGRPWPAWPSATALRDAGAVGVALTAAPGRYSLRLSAYAPEGSGFVPLPFACAGSAPGEITLATPQMQPLEDP
jgi:hypothetical protein